MHSSRDDMESVDQQMSRMLGGYRVTQMLFVAAELGIADALANGPKSVDELATAAKAEPRALFRILRALAALGVFAERNDGTFELTPLARTLQSDVPGSVRPFALSYGAKWWWASFGSLLDSVRTGKPAFELVHGMGLFDYLDRHPDAASTFNANMTAMTGVEADAVANAYDFSGLHLLADIGGGHGTLSAAILKRQPRARALIFDRPSVIDGAASVLEGLGLRDRCELVPGDFFASIPAGADVYTLKDILHDWDDDRSTAILRNVRDAMGSGARLLVIERVIPPGNDPSIGKQVDITMLAMTGGLERSEAEYRQLLAQAGLRLGRVLPTSTPSSVLEALPV